MKKWNVVAGVVLAGHYSTVAVQVPGKYPDDACEAAGIAFASIVGPEFRILTVVRSESGSSPVPVEV